MTIYIAAPFGNYIRTKTTRSVTGSFTLNKRKGLLKKIVTTLRYRDGSWYNKIGLRNPGIQSGLQQFKKEWDDIISLAAIEPNDWYELNDIVPNDIDVELNLSCPNIEHFKDYSKGIENFLKGNRKVIVKLSPHTTKDDLANLIASGFCNYHFCNTLPTENGGKSGKDLIPYVKKLISYFNELVIYRYNLPIHHFEIIAGGGITTIEDVLHYQKLGATSFSLGTICFNPVKFYKLYYDFKKYNFTRSY